MKKISVIGLILLSSAAALAQPMPAVPDTAPPPVQPPGEVRAMDTPNDAGQSISLTWSPSPDEVRGLVEGYVIYRAESPEAPDSLWTRVGYVPYGISNFEDQEVPVNGRDFLYRVKAVSKLGAEAWSGVSNASQSKEQWYNSMRTNALVASLLFVAIVVYFITMAQRGQHLFVRRIAGLSAVEEAVGRATEMGRPILYVPGLSTITDVATIAALNILGQVAKKTAEYDTPLLVPNRDPVVYTVAMEVVKEAYSEVGRPDAFNHDSVFYLTDSQMGYASGVDGIMAREKPATNFFMGMFWAESLVLAETGAATGAIQIAGTDAVHQLPFFITACDYTLIGEELYAASAYLARDPKLLGTLKGQDWSKAIIVMLLILTLILSLASPAIRGFVLNMLTVG
jgi:hypothetical protein